MTARGKGPGLLMRSAAVVAVWLAIGQFAQAQNICATGASPDNPLVARTPVEPGAGGIGGTGVSSGPAKVAGNGGGEGGIGGTGILASGPDPARIGTGQGGIGGTGIVGVITGFASICVNGVEVHFDAATPVSDAGELVSLRELAVGQLVSVSAAGSGSQVRARQIALIHTAVGPLAAVDARTGEFRVLGQSGRALAPGSLTNLVAGDWVRVGGQRLAGGVIAATRVERVPPQPRAQLNGVVGRMDGDTVSVGDALVRFDRQAMPAGLAWGMEITVTGQWDGRDFLAQQAILEPTRKGLGSVTQVVFEGYVHALGDRQLSLGLGDLTLSPGAQVVGAFAGKLAIDQRVQVTGRLGVDQRVTVDRVVIGEGPADGGRTGAPGASRGKSGRSGREARDDDDRSDRSGRSPRQQETSGESNRSSGSGDRDGSGGSNDSGSSSSSGGSGDSGGSDRSGGSDKSGESGSGEKGEGSDRGK